MRDLAELQDFWRLHQKDDLILATIVKKTGSGYRAPGAKKIIALDGTSCGYLSGGCLEGDIMRTALENISSLPFIKSFSTLSEEDRLMGYQTGCAGVIDILFERLPGIKRMREYIPFGSEAEDVCGVSISLEPSTLGQRQMMTEMPAEQPAEKFIDRWINPVALFVIGCGPNARPFAEIAPSLGWSITFLDYRREYRFEEKPGVQSLIVPLAEIGKNIAAGRNNAVIVMTHNYEADMAVVGQLNGKKFGYVGCVGPRKRFEQIAADLKTFHGIALDQAWTAEIHAPAGLRQGRSPEAIALSILAEIQFEPGAQA